MQDTPGVKVVTMSPQPENHDESMCLISETNFVAQLVNIRFEQQVVAKGRETVTTSKNTSLDLLLHELGKIN